MKAKKCLAVCTAVTLMALAVGCSGKTETGEEIITMKEEEKIGRAHV